MRGYSILPRDAIPYPDRATAEALHVPGVGITGNSDISFYLRIPALPGTYIYNYQYKLDDAHMAVYVPRNLPNQEGATWLMSIKSGARYGGIRPDRLAKASFWTNCGITTPAEMPVQGAKGLSIWSRQDPDIVNIYRSGVPVETEITSTNLPNDSVYLFGNPNIAGSYTDATASVCSFGSGLTVEEMETYRTIVTTALIDIGSIDDDDPDLGEQAFSSGCFTSADTAEALANFPSGFKIITQARAPTTNAETEATYLFFPMTDAATQQATRFALTGDDYNNWHFQWMMRKQLPPTAFNDRANVLSPSIRNSLGFLCWLLYSDYSLAIGAVEVVARWTLGFPQFVNDTPDYVGDADSTNVDIMGWGDAAIFWGFDLANIISWDDATAQADTFFPDYYESRAGNGKWYTCTDCIVLPQARLIDGVNPQGIVLDAEAQDDRSPALFKVQVDRLAALCNTQGMKLQLYCNPLTNPGAIRTGFSVSNLWHFHNIPNVYLCVVVWKQFSTTNLDTQVQGQLDLIRAGGAIDYGKIFLVPAMGILGKWQMSLSEADAVHNLMAGNGNPANAFAGMHIWRAFGIVGGAFSRTYNQILAHLLHITSRYV
jgi:hypothetical protein